MSVCFLFCEKKIDEKWKLYTAALGADYGSIISLFTII
jgi:hypothetical protein